MMRFSPLVLMLGLATSTVAIPAAGQRPDSQLAPRSVDFAKRGEAALAAGNYSAADDALETALVLDPRNRGAFVTMAKVAIKQKLFGRAIRLTNKALALEPTDRDALALQGEAMVDAGAVPRARETLAKLQKLCAGPCPQAVSLSAAISRGPALAEAKPAKAIPAKKTN
jgi:cytochrome c-type biogenesis protein CcmH/NrfG